MMRISMHRRRLGPVVALLVALAGAPASALATGGQSGAADRPVPVVGTMEGQLEPGPRAPFAYYRFVYPGGGRVASINLQVEPDLPTVLQSAGFRVYGPQRGRVYLTSGLQPGLVPNVTGDLVSEDAGVYLVQVYNYAPTVPVAFRIWVTGLPAEAATAPPDATTPDVAPEASSPSTGRAGTVQQASTAETAIALTRALPGHLDAGPDARFAYYRFNYQAGTPATINLNVTPDDGQVLGRVGFRVYGPRAGWVYATSGAQPGLTPNVSGDMLGDETGEYLIQVYDVDVLTPVDFVIWGTGMPQRAVESTTRSIDPSTPAPPPPGN
jgi:hypothetical protein